MPKINRFSLFVLYTVIALFLNGWGIVVSTSAAETVQSILAKVQSESAPTGPYSDNIVCAEQKSGKIIIFKPAAGNHSNWNDPGSIVWEWDASQSKEIQPEHRNWFSNPDECKPVLGTSHLLMTASGGGVALVRLSDKAALFYAQAGGNPHSAAMLPDGNVVSISSAGYFLVFAVPEKFTGPENVKSVRYPSHGGHGLVWDNAEKRLWVLGYTELAAYKYNFDKQNPVLTKEFFVPLEGTPASGGHDLYPVPGQRQLFTTGKGVAIFDLKTRRFTEISDLRGIKSVSLSPSGDLIVLSPTKDWWSESVTFLNEPLTPIGTRTGARIYKARWWVPNSMSEE